MEEVFEEEKPIENQERSSNRIELEIPKSDLAESTKKKICQQIKNGYEIPKENNQKLEEIISKFLRNFGAINFNTVMKRNCSLNYRTKPDLPTYKEIKNKVNKFLRSKGQEEARKKHKKIRKYKQKLKQGSNKGQKKEQKFRGKGGMIPEKVKEKKTEKEINIATNYVEQAKEIQE